MDANSATLAALEGLASDASVAALGSGLFAQVLSEIQQQIDVAADEQTLLQRTAECLRKRVGITSLVYYASRAGQRSADQLRRFSADPTAQAQPFSPQLSRFFRDAADERTVQRLSTADGFPEPMVIVPVERRSGDCDALAAVSGATTQLTADRIEELLQIVAARISIWWIQKIVNRAEQEAKFSSALVELICQLEDREDISGGCLAAVNHVQSFLGCERVAIGLCQGSSRHCRLEALSGFAKFDRHAEVTTAIEAALDEAVVSDETIRWPQTEDHPRQPARTHEQLLAVIGADEVISAPLKDAQGETVGAWLFLDPATHTNTISIDTFIDAAQAPLGTCLRSVQRTRGGLRGSLGRRFLGRSKRSKLVLTAVGIGLLAVLLAWRRPHRIGCDCLVQPTLRRFIAAPFDGTLERSLVKAGDVVEEADVLAIMDGREIRLERSALEAELARARKAWEISLALNDIHEAQQAKLDMKRLQLKMQMLRDREQNLQIKSPFSGIVVSGDLEESQGAPLTVGQTMFEIAPLEEMKVEIVIPEADIASVEAGMETWIRLDAEPKRKIATRITRIVPRAEVRDDQFVFVAEAELNDSEAQFRPGMNGRATLVGPRRSNAWLLFHKPYDSLLMWLGW